MAWSRALKHAACAAALTASEDLPQVPLYSAAVHPEDLDRVASEVVAAESDPNCQEFFHEPYRLVAADGSIRWVRDRIFIRRDETGRATHFQGILENITEQVEARQALEDGQYFFSNVLDSIQDGVKILDTDLNIMMLNETMKQWIGGNGDPRGEKCYTRCKSVE